MKPWEKYRAGATGTGPWAKYQSAAPEPVMEPSQYEPTDTGGFFDTARADVATAPDDIIQSIGNITPSDFYRPALEAGGAVGGAMLSGGTPTPLTLLASGLGYSIGANTADRLDELYGYKEPMPLSDIAKKSVTDIPVGAAFEAGGQAIAPAFKVVMRGGKAVLNKVPHEWVSRTLTKRGADKAAEAILEAHTSEGVIYAENIKAAKQLEKEIPGLKFTRGQRSGDPELIKLERAQMRAPGEASSLSVNQIADNTEAVRKYYANELGGEYGIDDVQRLMASKNRYLAEIEAQTKSAVSKKVDALPKIQQQETGREILEQISKAELPVKKTMDVLEKAIPEYPMEFKHLSDKIKSVKANRKLSIDQKKAIISVQKDLETLFESGKTTYSAMGARRTINNAIEKQFASGSDDVAAILIDVRSGLEADLSAVSKRAKTGKISEYKGQPVDVRKLEKQLELESTRLAKISSELKPDLQMMRKELSDVGYPSMQITMEGNEEYAKRLAQDYKARLGKDVQYISDKAQTRMHKELQASIAKNKEILSSVSPGRDVAASMRAYNKFASTEYFGRFDKGGIKLIKQARPEAIPSYFTTPSGADDLIRYVGKDKAAGIMKGHYSYSMLKEATNPSTGLVVETKMARWLAKNKSALNKYGLTGLFDDIHKSQITADAATTAVKDFEKSAAHRILKADPKSAIANAIKGSNMTDAAESLLSKIGDNKAAREGLKHAFADHIIDAAETTAKTIKNDPKVSLAAFSRLTKKYDPAIRVLYKNEPAKIKALKNMQDSYMTMARNTNSPIGAGSDSAENIATMISKSAAYISVSPKAIAVKTVIDFFNDMGAKRANTVLNRLLWDPDGAHTVQQVLKGKVRDDQIKMVLNNKVVSLAGYKAKIKAQAATAAGIMARGDSD